MDAHLGTRAVGSPGCGDLFGYYDPLRCTERKVAKANQTDYENRKNTLHDSSFGFIFWTFLRGIVKKILSKVK
jgi:hypothetical protein